MLVCANRHDHYCLVKFKARIAILIFILYKWSRESPLVSILPRTLIAAGIILIVVLLLFSLLYRIGSSWPAVHRPICEFLFIIYYLLLYLYTTHSSNSWHIIIIISCWARRATILLVIFLYLMLLWFFIFLVSINNYIFCVQYSNHFHQQPCYPLLNRVTFLSLFYKLTHSHIYTLTHPPHTSTLWSCSANPSTSFESL